MELMLTKTHVSALIINGGTMNQLTVADGLSGLSVINITEDKVGRLWLGTSHGVSVFDGIHFYTVPITTESTVGDMTCHALSLMPDGTAWMGMRSGIYRKQLWERSFTHVAPTVHDADALVCFGGFVYVGNHDGLFKIDSKGNVRRLYKTPNNHSSVNDIHVDAISKRVYFIVNNLLGEYNPITDDAPLIHRLPLDTYVIKFCLTPSKFFFGTATKGLFAASRRDLNHLRHIAGLPNSIRNVVVSGNNICVTVASLGAWRVNASTEQIEEMFSTHTPERSPLPSDEVIIYQRLANGTDCFGLKRIGFCYYFRQQPVFRYCTFGKETFRDVPVTSLNIFEPEMVIGTHDGFVYYNQQTGQTIIEPMNERGAPVVSSACRFGSQIFIGTNNGLFTYNPDLGSIAQAQGNDLLQGYGITDICRGPDGALWVTGVKGLFIFDKDGHVTNFNGSNSPLDKSTVLGVFFDGHGYAWMGTNRAVYRVDIRRRRILKDGFPKGFFNHVENLRFFQRHDGMIMAFGSNSLFYTNSRMTRFGEIALPPAMLSESLNDIVDDGTGHCWISTERGLFRCDYEMKELQKFDFTAGVPSAMAAENGLTVYGGNIWMATDEGLICANLKDLNYYQVGVGEHVNIFDAMCGQTKLSFEDLSRMMYDKAIRLSWNFVSTSFSFRPIVSDMGNADHRIYEYSVDGEPWQTSSAIDAVKVEFYTPGKHTLRLRLAGMSSTETTYKVSVVPSWLFWMEVVLVLVGVILLLSYLRLNHRANDVKEERDLMEQALIEAEDQQGTKEEVDVPEKEALRTEDYSRFEALAQQMDDFMKKERPYLNPDYRLSNLASHLGVSQSMISGLLKNYLHTSYYDYVNRYRLDEFKRMVADGTIKQFTIIAIIEKCGFKKTAFFAAFRKLEGMTPTEYIRKHN